TSTDPAAACAVAPAAPATAAAAAPATAAAAAPATVAAATSSTGPAAAAPGATQDNGDASGAAASDDGSTSSQASQDPPAAASSSPAAAADAASTAGLKTGFGVMFGTLPDAAFSAVAGIAEVRFGGTAWTGGGGPIRTFAPRIVVVRAPALSGQPVLP